MIHFSEFLFHSSCIKCSLYTLEIIYLHYIYMYFNYVYKDIFILKNLFTISHSSVSGHMQDWNFAHKTIKKWNSQWEYVMKLQNKLSLVSASRWIDSISLSSFRNGIPKRLTSVCKCHTSENEFFFPELHILEVNFFSSRYTWNTKRDMSMCCTAHRWVWYSWIWLQSHSSSYSIVIYRHEREKLCICCEFKNVSISSDRIFMNIKLDFNVGNHMFRNKLSIVMKMWEKRFLSR